MPGTIGDIAAASEANTLAFWRAVAPHLPGGELHDGPDATWFQSSVPFFPFNQVVRASFAPGEADAAVDAVVARFRSHGLPFCWNVGPASQPLDLASRLESRSPARSSSMPAMAIDLSQSLEAAAPPAALVIERVRDDAALDRWARAYRDGFDLQERFVATLRDAYAALGFADDGPFCHYVGLLDGAPVACSTMFLDAGACPERSRRVAALWHIATLPDQRKRGIGAALTLQPLIDAQALGSTIGVLYASEMGTPLYRRLGFREHFRLVQFGWQYEGQGV